MNCLKRTCVFTLLSMIMLAPGNLLSQDTPTELLGVWGDGRVKAVQILNEHEVLFNYGTYLKRADFTVPDAPVITKKLLTNVSGIDQVHYNNGFYYATNTQERERRYFYYSEDEQMPFRNSAGTVTGRELRIVGDLGFSYWLRNFYILDASNPADRIVIKSDVNMDIARPRSIRGYDVQGDTVYVSSNLDRIHLIDITDPSSASEVNAIQLDKSLGKIQVSGNRMYVAFGDRTAGYYDISDITEPVLVAVTEPFDGFSVADVYATGQLLFVHASSTIIGGADELHIFDISDEENPVLTETIRPGVELFDFGVSGDNIFLAAGQAGLMHYTLDELHDATLVSVIEGTGRIANALHRDEYAYVVTEDSLLHVVDVSTHTAPHTTGQAALAGIMDMLFYSDQFIIQTNSTGFEVIDVSNSADPKVVSVYESEAIEMGHVYAAVTGHYVYLFKTHSSRQTRIEKVNISDVSNPERVSVHSPQSFSSSALKPKIYGDYLIAVDRAFGGNLEVYDISDPQDIFWAGDRNIPILGSTQLYGHYLAGTQGSSIWLQDLSALPTLGEIITVELGDDLNGLVIDSDRAVTGSFPFSADPSKLISIDLENREESESVAIFTFEISWFESVYLPQNPRLVGADSEQALVISRLGSGLYLYNIKVEPTSAQEISAGTLPAEVILEGNYPNPFNPATNIRFTLPVSSEVSLGVYDVTGRKIKTIASGFFTAGSHTVVFDGAALASGMYLYRLDTPSSSVTGRMTLMK